MNMKKKVLSAAVAAAFAGSAGAVSLSNDNTGEAFVVPFYSVKGDHQTRIQILNTTGSHKAVKVRFREARNTRDVLDFNLYLSPYDVWVAKVEEHPKYGAVLIPYDTSCTVPLIEAFRGHPVSGEPEAKVTVADVDFVRRAYAADPDNGQSRGMAVFSPFDYLEDPRPNIPDPGSAISWKRHVDGGLGSNWQEFVAQNNAFMAGERTAFPDAITRAMEGYIEIIEMGIENPDMPWSFDSQGQPNYATPSDPEHLHDQDPHGYPKNCQGLVNAWTNWGTVRGQWFSERNWGFLPPAGGLQVNARIFEGSLGAEFDIPVTVLEEFMNQPNHTDPGDSRPNLASAAPAISRVVVHDLPNGRARVVSDVWENGIDAVSAVLMTRNVQGHYSINPAVNAATSFVVTFPTKSDYVDFRLPRGEGEPYRTAASPFSQLFQGYSCDPVVVSYMNREERPVHIPVELPDAIYPEISPPIYDVVAPTPTMAWSLCQEMNVVNFGIKDTVSPVNQLYSDVAVDLLVENEYFRTGWASLNFLAPPIGGNDGLGDVAHQGPGHEGHHLVNPFSGHVYQGLPAIAFGITKVRDGANQSYASASPLRYNRVVRSGLYRRDAGDIGLHWLPSSSPNVSVPCVPGLEYCVGDDGFQDVLRSR